MTAAPCFFCGHRSRGGRAALEAATGYRAGAGEAVHRWILRHPNAVLVGGIAAGTAAALAAVFWLAGPDVRATVPLVRRAAASAGRAPGACRGSPAGVIVA